MKRKKKEVIRNVTFSKSCSKLFLLQMRIVNRKLNLKELQ